MTDILLSKPRSPRKWTHEALSSEASKYSSRADFSTGSAGAYQAARERGLLTAICKHMPAKMVHWTDHLAIQTAKKFSSISQFQDLHPGGYNYLTKRGLREAAFSHMLKSFEYRSDDELIQLAKQYSDRRAFKAKEKSAYALIQFRGIKDAAYAHMTLLTKEWADAELAEVALSYSTKTDFIKGNRKAYAVAWHRGLLEGICAHMVPRAVPSDSVYLWEAVGLGIFKFGVAIYSDGDLRMHAVSQAMGTVPSSIIHIKAQQPRKVEAQLLKLGRPVAFEKSFQGYTEFRHLNALEIIDALRIFSKAIAA